jgi:hypothetical protein
MDDSLVLSISNLDRSSRSSLVTDVRRLTRTMSAQLKTAQHRAAISVKSFMAIQPLLEVEMVWLSQALYLHFQKQEENVLERSVLNMQQNGINSTR